MKRIIRLTERDLTRIVKRTIREMEEDRPLFDIEDVDILHLEINRDRPDKVRIKIHFNTNNPASNMESWLVRTLCDEMNRFFPFTIAAFWEPAFAGRGVTVVLDSEQIVNGDDEEID